MAEAASSVVSNDGQQGSANDWHSGFDADTKTWLGGMGVDKLPERDALAKVIPMYRAAEQKLGVPADQLLRLPKDDNDADGFKAIMSRLGAPEKPEDYGIQAPEGSQGEFLKAATGWFHELGIPKRQAAGLAAKWNEYAQSQQAAQDGAWNQRFDSEIEALKGEWGADYDKNHDFAQRVMKSFGYDAEQLKAIERAVGPKAMLAGFAKFGAAIGEHRFVEGAGGQQFGGMSPEAAKQRIAALQADAAWTTKYINGDADAKAEFTRLNQLAFPETFGE